MNQQTRQIVFLLYAVALLGFLSSMIWSEQKIREEGRLYKFRCEPVDPKDPFRGAYVRLNMQRVRKSAEEDPLFDQYQYAAISEDADGYGVISNLLTQSDDDGVMVPIEKEYANDRRAGYRLPFSRYYMTEEKAQAAEDLLRDSFRDSTLVVYATVYIEGGEYALEGLFVNDQPIEALLEE